MDKFIGTKIVSAEPCQAWKDSGNYKVGDEGYKVVYEDGYESWSPKEVFEKHYRAVGNMDFGAALVALKCGQKVARSGWNGKGMWLCLIRAGNAMHGGFAMQDCIGMKTASNDMQPGWLASQSDMLADDWVIVE